MKRQYGVVIGVAICLLVSMWVPLQQASAQSANGHELTLASLDYRDVTLYGHTSDTKYYFALPPSWQVVGGSYFDLDFEYATPLVSSPETASAPTARFEVDLNGKLVHSSDLFRSGTYQVRIELPTEMFYPRENAIQNYIEVRFVGYEPCELDVPSSMMIHNTSRFHLVYQEYPWQVDLARFPHPIHQYRSVESSRVLFVLPDRLDENDLRAATIVASRLGQLTYNGVVISATLASEFSVDATLDEHLVLVGSPDSNPIIGQLELPIPLVDRQLALRSQMPTTVSSGSILSYTLFVENTGSIPQALFVEDRFSSAGAFLGCGESCELVAPRKIRWDVGTLAAGQSASMTVTLRVTPVTLSDVRIRHTAALFDSLGNILNVDTLVSQIGEEPDGYLVTSADPKSTRFFARELQAVPEDAGVIQEIVSPWSARRVAVIVTGLDGEGVLKAASGLNPRNRFPGISGDWAVVEDMRSSSLPVSVPPQDVTFSSLGYEDRELDVLGLESALYSFELPPTSALAEDAHLALHFAHTAVVSSVGGGIKITLNDMPIGSAYLDDSNLDDAWIYIPLNRGSVRPGSNDIRIHTTVSQVDRCMVNINNPFWLEIYADSYLHLGYKSARLVFDLGRIPYPFNRPGDMGNVMFALPDAPSSTDVEALLRVASLLGRGSKSAEFMPQVILGGSPDATSLSGYHVVAVGLPMMNVVIRAVNAQLPQPFVPDSNDIYQSIDSPVYGVAPGTDLGVVQALASPWERDGKHVLMVVTGTTEEGVRWAASALSRLSYLFKGNMALVRGDQVYRTDTRPVSAEEVFTGTVSLTPASTGTPVRTAVATPTPQAWLEELIQTPMPQGGAGQAVAVTSTQESSALRVASSRPTWLILLLIVGLLAIAALIFLLVRKTRV